MNRQWSVVTVTYNSLDHLKRHWRSSDEGREFRWIVVDNGSTDGSLDFARTHADVVVESGRNAGFAVANNIGLDEVDSEFTMFANPDVTVPGDGWQARMASLIDASGGLVAPQLLNSDGSLQANARGWPFLASKVRNRLRPETPRGLDYARSGFDKPTYCAWVMGAALGGRTVDLRRIGGWDESYFLYYEDHEIGLRAWRSGLSVIVDPETQFVHDWQRATTRVQVAPWRFELDSMRTFFRAHPEFLTGSRARGRKIAALRSVGYEKLADRLWTPFMEGSA